eukprot:6468400-Amphidinium_carterae.1
MRCMCTCSAALNGKCISSKKPQVCARKQLQPSSQICLVVMSSESQQAFKLMVSQPGVLEEVRSCLAASGIDTMAKLAYRSKGKQGELSGKEFEESVLTPLANEIDGAAATA